MSFKWTPQQVVKLLSAITFTIYRKGTTPDYNFLAAHLGASREGVKQKFNKLRRSFQAQNQAVIGAKEPILKKDARKVVEVDSKEEEIEEKKPVKKSRSGKGGVKADAKR